MVLLWRLILLKFLSPLEFEKDRVCFIIVSCEILA
jgi:hypothetical protein